MVPIDIKSSAIDVGVADRRMGGWCNSNTGALVPDVIVKPGLQVVDIGCGDGGYAKFCSDQGADVTFVDVQESKVRALEDRLKDTATGTIKGIVSECDPIPLPDEYADVVISTEVLEHVRDPEKVLREIVRLGRSNATYVLTVPDARGENVAKDFAPDECFQEPNHIQIFTSDDFEKLADKCGLEVVRHEYLSSFWAIFYLFKWATAQPGETLTDNAQPLTYLWTQTWKEALNHPNGEKIRAALDLALPRSQMIVARKKSVNSG